ncbi:MAG: hypothetical protein ABI461_03995 [Polyangiaceae bacterium]
MANDLQTRAEHLFESFMAPLVLGGELRPGRILGARTALALGAERSVTNLDLAAHVDLARVRIARKLAPIDRIAPATPSEWALAACLHDIVQSTHPALAGLFRNNASRRILELVGLALDRIPPPANAKEALTRHTWFSRALEIGRTDTRVSWWVGSEIFRGTDPPPRLLSWPDLRRVHIDCSVHPLCDLPTTEAKAEAPLFYEMLRRWLSLSPITDLANAHRAAPKFVWTEPTIALASSRIGRTLALRAIRSGSLQAKMTAIEEATLELLGLNVQARAIAHALLDEMAFFRDSAMRQNLPHDDVHD